MAPRSRAAPSAAKPSRSSQTAAPCGGTDLDVEEVRLHLPGQRPHLQPELPDGGAVAGVADGVHGPEEVVRRGQPVREEAGEKALSGRRGLGLGGQACGDLLGDETAS